MNDTSPAVEILPSEILSHVFVVGGESSPINAAFELSVSQVSRRWRAVSIDTQELWGKVAINWPLDRVSAYVDRSKAYGLSIFICPGLEHDDATGILREVPAFFESLDSFFQIVKPAAPRWCRLIVWTYGHVAMAQVLDHVMRLSVPQLKFLQLTQDTNAAPPDPIVSGDIFQSFFSGAHSLNQVQFHLVHLPWISFPATNVQDINIGGLSRHITMNYGQLRQVLTSSPRLVKLALMGASPDVEDHRTYPPIILPALRHLHVSSLDSSPNLSIFHLLSTPVLNALEIVQAGDLKDFFSEINTTPLKYPFVTSLTLKDISVALETTDIFSAFPNVSYFDISGSIAYRMFALWSYRVVHPDRTVIWPDLHTLSIDETSVGDVALAQIIKLRHKYGKPLRTLRMTEVCRRNYSARMWQWLNEQVTIEVIPVEVVEELEAQDAEGLEGEVQRDNFAFEFDPYETMWDPNEPIHEDAYSTIPDDAVSEADSA